VQYAIKHIKHIKHIRGEKIRLSIREGGNHPEDTPAAEHISQRCCSVSGLGGFQDMTG